MPSVALTSARLACDEVAADQGGALSRAQVLGLGMTDEQIAHEIDGRRWQRSAHEGVYFVTTGPVSYLSQCWAALLHAGEGSALGMESAAWAWGLLDRPPDVVHVMVAGDRRPARQTGVRFHIRTALASRVHPVKRPALVRLEDTVLDQIDRASTTEEQVIDLVLRACQRRLTTADRLLAAVGRRKKMRHRGLVLDLLVDARAGVQSPLERRYARDVERPHGLPRSRSNRPEGRPGRRRFRDARYDAYALVVELDGDPSHPMDRKELDDIRDNELLEQEGTRTLRYGWRSVTSRSCATAAQVGDLLRQGGWVGTPRRCGPACRLPDTS